MIQDGCKEKGVGMARKKHKAEEIIPHLRTVEIEQSKGHSLQDASRKVGVSYQTIIRWCKEYDGLDADQAKKLKQLELENSFFMQRFGQAGIASGKMFLDLVSHDKIEKIDL